MAGDNIFPEDSSHLVRQFATTILTNEQSGPSEQLLYWPQTFEPKMPEAFQKQKKTIIFQDSSCACVWTNNVCMLCALD